MYTYVAILEQRIGPQEVAQKCLHGWRRYVHLCFHARTKNRTMTVPFCQEVSHRWRRYVQLYSYASMLEQRIGLQDVAQKCLDGWRRYVLLCLHARAENRTKW